MAQFCGECGEMSYRLHYKPGSKKFLCEDCAGAASIMVDSDNPFRNNGELVLEHVHEDGKPLRVTSMRQLEAAQNRLHFNHIPTNMDRANWDKPKQQQAYTVGDLYRRKFARA